MEVSGQFHAPAAFSSEKEPPIPLGRRLGGPQSRSGSCGEEKNLLPLPGLESLPSSMQSLAIPKKLSQLLFLTNVTGKATLFLCLIKHHTNEDIRV
jgi:hypothetical protein